MKEGFLGELHFLINLASLDEKSVTADLRNYLSLTVDIGGHFEPICVLSHHVDGTSDAICSLQGNAKVCGEDNDEA